MIKTDILRTVATLACTFVLSATCVLAAVAPAHQVPAHQVTSQTGVPAPTAIVA